MGALLAALEAVRASNAFHESAVWAQRHAVYEAAAVVRLAHVLLVCPLWVLDDFYKPSALLGCRLLLGTAQMLPRPALT